MTLRLAIVSLTILVASSATHAQPPLGHELEKQAPIREGEEPVIPLDTGDPSYDIWRTLRDFSEDPPREPGIINLQKYDMGMS